MIWRAAVLAALALSSCYKKEQEPAAARAANLGEPVQFTFGTVEGTELSSDSTRGRTTALLFVTTYDLPSQAQAQMLGQVIARHKPLANAGVVMLEPPQSAALAQVWRESIGLTLPVAMASPMLLAGESQLGRVHGVPTLLVLDRRGRVVVRREGALTRAELIDCLKQADAR